MSLLAELNEDIKTAMKSRDKERLSVLRMIKSSLLNEEIAKGSELNSDEELTVLAREKKQRNESLEEFTKADRQDLVLKLENEIVIVDEYLPQQLSQEEVAALVKEAVRQTGASSMADMGKVMGALMPKVKGKADGNIVSSLVKSELQNK